MKTFLAIIFILFFPFLLSTEEEIPPENELKEDFLLLLQEKLQQEIDKIDYLSDYFELPFFIFTQNYHLSGLFHNPFWLEKNGFLITSTDAETGLQLYAPFYQVTHSNNFIKLKTSTYQEQVTLAKSYLGMGANDMNHAFVSFRKGNFLKRFTTEFAFLTYDGKWHVRNEKTQMYHGNLYFPTAIGKWQVSTSVIEDFEQYDSVQFKGSDFDITWDNPVFSLGYRREIMEENSQKEKNQYFLEQKGRLKNHMYRIKCTLKTNQNFYYQLESASQFSNIRFSNSAIWKSKNTFSWQTNLLLENFHDFEFHVAQNEFSTSETTLFYPALNVGFSWNFSELFGQTISYEKHFFQNDYYNGVTVKNCVSIPWNSIRLNYENNMQYLKNENILLPAWLVRQKISFAKFLAHDNSIHLGISYYLTGQFYNQSGEKNKVNVLNAFVRFQISKLFEIQFSGINLLLHSFESYIPYEEAYLSVGLKWIFIN